jgi:hypothetical protein
MGEEHDEQKTIGVLTSQPRRMVCIQLLLNDNEVKDAE